MIEHIESFLIHNPLIELGFITAVLVFFGYAASLIRQPVLVGYIVGGLLLGPEIFDILHHYEQMALYGHFGVSLLLFMVGLGLNPKIIKEVGKISIIAGVGQVVFTSVIGYFIALLLGFSSIYALFIAIALTFSSTIIVVKLVSDRGDSGTQYGKISFGILIVQDIIAMLILLAISASTASATATNTNYFIGVLILKLVLLLSVAWISAIYILPKLLYRLSKEKELLLIFAIAWAILFGGMWYYAGFSLEIGALLAGVTLANSHYRYHIFSELRPLRDFFLALFFVYLGGQIVFENVGIYILPLIIFSLFVLIGNPLIIISLMQYLGHSKKDSFMTGLTVAQISEFSFIVMGLALTSGIIENEAILSMITIIGLITMTGSSYMFAHAETIYKKISPRIQYLHVGSVKTKQQHTPQIVDDGYRIIIIGFGRLGTFIAAKLRAHQIPFCIIDNNNDKIHQARKKGYTAVYGDIEDYDTIMGMISSRTEILYATTSDHDTNIHILHTINESDYHIRVILLALYMDEAENLYNHGADYIIFPHLAGAHESWDVIEKYVWNPESFMQNKIEHRKSLQQHQAQIHDTRSEKSNN